MYLWEIARWGKLVKRSISIGGRFVLNTRVPNEYLLVLPNNKFVSIRKI